ncbi:hypothetical protein NEICINOT_04235 [Neisseria cinerea ATCC 14685]|uniref:Uncharacterized protein n=1 Tax=Neisseria cinerea ATCC 14685 TaxID=546262 RepID=D0W3J5_NEICI|nr:hypothetical protein NEICINOT_04235 [Neisseria cinerea ATCC 14685]
MPSESGRRECQPDRLFRRHFYLYNQNSFRYKKVLFSVLTTLC